MDGAGVCVCGLAREGPGGGEADQWGSKLESPSTYRFEEGHQTAEADPTLLRVYNETGVTGSPCTRPSAQCSWPGLRRNLRLSLPRGPYGRREEERCTGLRWLGFALLCKAGKEVRLLQGLLMRSREKQIGTHPLPPHWHRLNLNPSPEFFGKLGALRRSHGSSVL